MSIHIACSDGPVMANFKFLLWKMLLPKIPAYSNFLVQTVELQADPLLGTSQPSLQGL